MLLPREGVLATHTDIEQAQPPGPHPPQPPAPAMAPDSPLELLENAAKTDSCRDESPSHSGHAASSSMRLMGLSRSNLCAQVVHAYSYIGIFLSFLPLVAPYGSGWLSVAQRLFRRDPTLTLTLSHTWERVNWVTLRRP